ncbi:hypothetical protein ACF0H5_001460 [Mactra antiquata]
MDKLIKILFVLWFSEYTYANDLSECPTKVRESKHLVRTYKDHCYMFVNVEKYWDEARQFCWKMGGEMLYVPDSETMGFVKSVLNSKELGWDSNGVWNGASDLRNKGWEWTNGKRLQYQYWAEGEPSKILGFMSIENCCNMRREDGWRWHDYHCHLLDYEYNFICQFARSKSNHASNTDAHAGGDTSQLLDERDDSAALIGLIIAGAALLIVFCAAILFLYRKHERQKRELEKRHQRHVIRFQNTGYATIMQDVSLDPRNSNSDLDRSLERPVSNIYLDPVEVTRVYDEVNKNSNITGAHNFANSSNSLDHNHVSDTSETARLVYTGGASSAGDLASAGLPSASPSEAAGATSALCSHGKAPSIESEYVEMSGGNSLESGSSLYSNSPAIGTCNSPANGDCTTDKMEYLKGGANGSVHDLKASNLYVTPDQCTKLNNNSPLSNGKPKNTEIHIYSNRLDELDNSLRPLPPLPNSDDSIPGKTVN